MIRRLLLFCALLAGSSLPAADLTTDYQRTLLTMCDALVATQITDTASPDRGALVCPSTNPQEHPLHSRAGESVYPLAVAWQQTHAAKYRDTAIALAAWMIGKQQPSGAWGEDWPKYDGWAGTTSDQLISLAGAWPMLKDELSAKDRELWQHAMRGAADYVAKTFPAGNVNYQPTGAVALVLASRAVESPPAAWQTKAVALMNITLGSINADGFLTGEGNGVDLGYNLAQSIGYIALYGLLTDDAGIRQRAAEMLRVHECFVYPNGSVDNSWGTRSFKWVYESGTKTAPGVAFSFALLRDLDPSFAPTEYACFEFLRDTTMRDGLVLYGPYAAGHGSTNPPCLYSTFARAQSIAMALAYAPTAGRKRGVAAGVGKGWSRFFPTVKIAVARTSSMMATVSAYGEVSRYGREQVSRGGSITNLWIDGFGPLGLAQTSSVTNYKREERTHMPNEENLRPLTPRLECTIGGATYTNLYEAAATMTVTHEPEHTEVCTRGELCGVKGEHSGVSYTLVHCFYADRLVKEYRVSAATTQPVRIIEPWVKAGQLSIVPAGAHSVTLNPGGKSWQLDFASDADVTLHIGEDAEKYWSPFPAVDCVPVVGEFSAKAGEETVVTVTLRSVP